MSGESLQYSYVSVRPAPYNCRSAPWNHKLARDQAELHAASLQLCGAGLLCIRYCRQTQKSVQKQIDINLVFKSLYYH